MDRDEALLYQKALITSMKIEIKELKFELGKAESEIAFLGSEINKKDLRINELNNKAFIKRQSETIESQKAIIFLQKEQLKRLTSKLQSLESKCK